MKILKHGVIKEDKERYHIFTCHECGCIFKAAEEEYSYNFVYDVSVATCPYCKSLVLRGGQYWVPERLVLGPRKKDDN